MEITYVLQITTIVITLFLGIISYLQTHKIQEGQNIIAVTTKYRSERCEQLKEAGASLLTNTSADLLKSNLDTLSMLKNATQSYEKIGMIMHRNFEADKELISLAKKIINAAFEYVDNTNEANLKKLTYLQETFRLKCDLYTVADWNRIKQETKGQNTSSESWISYHLKLESDFKDEFKKIEDEYLNHQNIH